MKRIIDIDEDLYEAIKNDYFNMYNGRLYDMIRNSTPHETVTEFADRCRECGAKYGKAAQFAKWVATEIFDEMFEYNQDAFAELACRKLAKLGIVREKDDGWEFIESQEWEHDHEILKAYEDGANDALYNVKAEIEDQWQLKTLPGSAFSCGLKQAIKIIDKYKSESEVESC